MYDHHMDGLEDALEAFGIKLAGEPKKSKHKKKKRSFKDQARRAAGTAVGTTGVLTAHHKLINQPLNELADASFSNSFEGRTLARVKDLRKGMGLTSNDVGIKIIKGDPTNGVYAPDTKAWRRGNLGKGTIYASKSSPTALLAHEMGHAKNYAALNRVPYAGKPLIAGAHLSSVHSNADTANPYRGPTALMSYYSALKDDPSYVPAMVNLGVGAPLLLDETMASARATKYLIGKQGLGRGLKSSLPLIPSLATYMTYHTVPFGITAGRKWWRKRHPSEHEQFEEAAADEPVEEPESSEESVASK